MIAGHIGDGEWKMVLRQPTYEKDRMDPVDPSVRLEPDPDILARFPSGIAISLTCKTVSAIRSTRTCRASTGLRSNGYTPMQLHGWKVRL